MTLFEVRYKLPHERHVPGESVDALGNRIDSWEPAEELPVWLIAPGAMEEPDDANRDLSHIQWTLYCPHDVQVHERDRITRGEKYEVDGRPGVWVGPNQVKGTVIRLARAEG